jgi:hypothetical protein
MRNFTSFEAKREAQLAAAAAARSVAPMATRALTFSSARVDSTFARGSTVYTIVLDVLCGFKIFVLSR